MSDVVGVIVAPQMFTAVVNNEPVIVYRGEVPGEQGRPGEQGIMGPAGTPNEYIATAHNMDGFCVVVINAAGLVEYANKNNTADTNRIIGVTTQGALSGNEIEIRTGGELSNSFWNWDLLLPVYLDASGTISQTPSVIQVGVVITPTSILVNPKQVSIDASETSKGIAELATMDEVLAGLSTTHIVTPSTLSRAMSYVHNQSTSLDDWEINHQLNRFPSITVVDSAGTEVEGQVTYIDNDTISILFNGAFSGKAFLS